MEKLIQALHKNGFPIKLENRRSSDSWTYNGDSIAIFRDTKRYTDHDILHEIGHYLAATPDQRLFPEFGLALGIADGMAWGLPSDGLRNQDGVLHFDFCKQIADGLISSHEQNIQEFLAQKIAIFFGRFLNCAADLLEESFNSWDDYESMKENSWKDDFEEIQERFCKILPVLEQIVKEVEI